MHNARTFLMMLFLCCLLPAESLLAGVNADINGSIQTDNRVRLDTQEFTWNDTRLTLKIGGSGDAYQYFSEMELKGLRTSPDDDLDWEWNLREAYIDLFAFLSDNLDVRIGKQIIAWGKADQLNPTSNVCPDDLEDTFDFGQKVGVNAVQATYYLSNLSFAAIFVPEFVPAELPSSDLASAFAPPVEPPQGMTFREITQHTVMPERTLDETSQYAFKLSTMLLDYDVSFSYFYGRDDLPLAGSLTMMPVDAEGTTDLDIELIYPTMQVIGADFAGQVSSVGVWGEGALFLPEKVDMPTYLQTPEGVELLQETVALDDEPYFKFVVGGDYNFKNGIYVNFQYMHGFFQERGEELNDYFVFRIEKDFLNDELLIAPFGGALAITDWDDAGSNYGFVTNPEMTYYPADNIELILGVFLLDGKGDNMFSQIKDQDQVYFKAKVSF